MEINLKQNVKIYKSDVMTPISLYLKFIGDNEGILLESAEVDGRLGRYSLLAWDFRFLLKCLNGKLDVNIIDPQFSFLNKYKGMDYFDALKQIINIINIESDNNRLPSITRSLIGYFGYECISLMESILKKCIDEKDAESILVFPGKQILYDHLHLRCYYISLDESKLEENSSNYLNTQIKIGDINNSFTKDLFCHAVQKTKDLIYKGEAIQVVLSNRFSTEFSGNPFVIYRRLRQENPSPYMFYLKLLQITLIGSSPELMVRGFKGNLEVRPIAGTRPRGRTEDEDKKLAEELINDPKERAEHVMLVDLGRNDLGRIAKGGSVKVEKFMEIEKFSHVMHLTSYVSAKLKEGFDAIDILKATFPAGTVSGAPKIRAMEIISEMEPIPRGPYAGAIGWIGLGKDKKDIDTGIIIRSLWIKEDKVYWQAGAGIVFDSIPEKEWEECHNKAKVILKVLQENGGHDAFIN